MLNTEIWRDVEDLPYEVSNLGTVRRKAKHQKTWKNKTSVRPYMNSAGYSCIHLYKNSKMHSYLVHRLIAQMFIPNPENLPEVNHIDGNPLNNSISNLEWCTHQYNMQHAWDTGLHDRDYPANAGVKRKHSSSKYHGVCWNEERKKWCVQVKYKGKLYLAKRFNDEVEAAKAVDETIRLHGLEQYGYKLNFS